MQNSLLPNVRKKVEEGGRRMTNEEVIRILMAMKDGLVHIFDHDRKVALEKAISAPEKQIPKNQKTYSLLKTLPDMHFQKVENAHVAEKLLRVIAIRGYATFVDRQLVGVTKNETRRSD